MLLFSYSQPELFQWTHLACEHIAHVQIEERVFKLKASKCCSTQFLLIVSSGGIYIYWKRQEINRLCDLCIYIFVSSISRCIKVSLKHNRKPSCLSVGFAGLLYCIMPFISVTKKNIFSDSHLRICFY